MKVSLDFFLHLSYFHSYVCSNVGEKNLRHRFQDVFLLLAVNVKSQKQRLICWLFYENFGEISNGLKIER